MKITEVRYHALFNLGNYENEKFELVARMEEGNTVEEVIEALKLKVHELAGVKDAYYEKQKLNRELKNIAEKIAKAQIQWEQIAEFLKAQGLRPDAPSFPALNLLPSAQEEVITPVDYPEGYPDY
jgi:DNA repair ATPase RecN